jgi:hypothetical protein
MNFYLPKKCLVTQLLTVIGAFSACAAHAQHGMLEIHGVITSPVCKVNFQTVAQLSKQSHLNGQACGLVSDERNLLSQLNIARVKQETWFNANGVDTNKRLVTLNYH